MHRCSHMQLTKLRQDQKQALQEEFHEGGQRNALQVSGGGARRGWWPGSVACCDQAKASACSSTEV